MFCKVPLVHIEDFIWNNKIQVRRIRRIRRRRRRRRRRKRRGGGKEEEKIKRRSLKYPRSRRLFLPTFQSRYRLCIERMQKQLSGAIKSMQISWIRVENRRAECKEKPSSTIAAASLRTR
jgi:hypothetical protein